ncbi:Cytochrome P450 [Penicillium brasilianum]|uniref:Cytochrome P450 n=1 Tax=Penicillium brasilianum TaxID=104259 RepID=A0A1S9RCY7_PENBI|nr:Cytochrome P450 [Penicillium brasilianum]
MAKYPRDTAGQIIPILLTNEYPELQAQGLVCMDAWPIANPLLAVFQPDMIAQFCQSPSMPKSDLLHSIFKDFTNCQDLLCSDGDHWKRWRSIFNPGFSSKNILLFIPALTEESQVFKDTLLKNMRSDIVFPLITPATKATFDIIGRVVLGAKLGVQVSESRLYTALKDQLGWISIPDGPNIFHRQNNPFRRLATWNNNRILHNEIIPILQRQMLETDRSGSPQTISRLAIEARLKETGHAVDSTSINQVLDEEFLRVALAQVEIFLIAGHDTTSSTLCYAYYCLHGNPDIADRVREEHDHLLGPDPAQAAAVIASDPSVLYRMPYTAAVIKEVLRLYPPIASIRSGSRSLHLVHPETGQQFSTEGFTLMSTSQASHRLPQYWPRPNDFLPDRWLVEEDTSVNGRKLAWRPFEQGPRNCIGQELAMLELRLMLVMTLRELDIIPAYAANATRLFGEPAYQAVTTNELTNRPKDGMPVRVRRRVPGTDVVA